MSLHRSDYLVPIHQADLARHAAEARLARSAKEAGSAPASEHRISMVHRIASLVGAVRRAPHPHGSAAKPAVRLTTGSAPATGGSRP